MRSCPAALTGGAFSGRILGQASLAVNAGGRTCLTLPASRTEPDGHLGGGDHPQEQEAQNLEAQEQDRHEGDCHFLALAAQDRVDAQQAHPQPERQDQRDDGRAGQQRGDKVVTR